MYVCLDVSSSTSVKGKISYTDDELYCTLYDNLKPVIQKRLESAKTAMTVANDHNELRA